VEDVGIALGKAFDQALGDKKGNSARRLFSDANGRNAGHRCRRSKRQDRAVVKTKVKTRLVGDLQSELVNDFFEGFAQGARANVHLKVMYGRSSHHKIEAICSRRLRAPCVSLAPATSSSATCCRAPKDCYERPASRWSIIAPET
jgi:imidazoleglycerol-phosphate dehydratase